MRLGIDASNIRAGGGITHLVEFLAAAEPGTHGFAEVIVWGGQSTLSRIQLRPWLVKSCPALLERSLGFRTLWQCFRLSKVARLANCDVLFVLGGSYVGDFRPVVTLSQNLLPFEWREMLRFGASSRSIKFWLLRWVQAGTFRRSNGVIFLTSYAKRVVTHVAGKLRGRVAVVPHGIDDRFVRPPRRQRPLSECSISNPFRFLYVSTIDSYKHQWNVAEAVSSLRASGFPVTLDLVGESHGPALARLDKTLKRVDPDHTFIRYVGEVPFDELHGVYEATDLFIFASSCETFSNVLLESMASGLPIACSDRGPMREVLGEAGVYFDPENVDSIGKAMEQLIVSPALRSELAQAAFERVSVYSWRRCADETFSFLAEVARCPQQQ